MTNIQFKTIYNYYDLPLNFTSTTNEGKDLLYAHLIDTDENGMNTYWVVPTTEQRISEAEKRVIDVRTFMTLPGFAEEVLITTADGERVTLDLETATMLYEDLLPKAGTYLLDEEEEPHWKESDGEWI